MTRKYTDDDKRRSFELYYQMGEDRSYRAVGEDMGIGQQTISSWAKKGDWDGKCEKMHMQEVLKLDDMLVEKNVEASQRHIKLAKTIQYKALLALTRMKFKSATEASNALAKAVHIERQARNMTESSDTKKGDTYNVQNNNYNFSEAELHKMLDDEIIELGVLPNEESDPSREDQAVAEEQEGEVPTTLSQLSSLEEAGRTVEDPDESHFLGICEHERPASCPAHKSVPGQAGISGVGGTDAHPTEATDREKPSDDGD